MALLFTVFVTLDTQAVTLISRLDSVAMKYRGLPAWSRRPVILLEYINSVQWMLIAITSAAGTSLVNIFVVVIGQEMDMDIVRAGVPLILLITCVLDYGRGHAAADAGNVCKEDIFHLYLLDVVALQQCQTTH